MFGEENHLGMPRRRPRKKVSVLVCVLQGERMTVVAREGGGTRAVLSAPLMVSLF